MTPEQRVQWRHDNIDEVRTRLKGLVDEIEKVLRARHIKRSRARIIADLRVAIPHTQKAVMMKFRYAEQDPDEYDVCAALMDEVYEEMLKKELERNASN